MPSIFGVEYSHTSVVERGAIPLPKTEMTCPGIANIEPFGSSFCFTPPAPIEERTIVDVPFDACNSESLIRFTITGCFSPANIANAVPGAKLAGTATVVVEAMVNEVSELGVSGPTTVVEVVELVEDAVVEFVPTNELVVDVAFCTNGFVVAVGIVRCRTRGVTVVDV